MNMLKVAEEYPDYVMMGGIYKHMFEPEEPALPVQIGRFNSTDVHRAIDEELERVVKPMGQQPLLIRRIRRGLLSNSVSPGLDQLPLSKVEEQLPVAGSLRSKLLSEANTPSGILPA